MIITVLMIGAASMMLYFCGGLVWKVWLRITGRSSASVPPPTIMTA
jgi:hypothetical protein